jgi:hypothetical protein
MDFAKILGQLREELKNVEAAIQTLERLQQSTRRRPRPSEESDLPGREEPLPPIKSSPTPRTSASRRQRRSDPNTT